LCKIRGAIRSCGLRDSAHPQSNPESACRSPDLDLLTCTAEVTEYDVGPLRRVAVSAQGQNGRLHGGDRATRQRASVIDEPPPTNGRAATPGSQPEPRFGRSVPKPCPRRGPLTKRQRCLQKFSAGISLVILSLGFSFLGLLSFFNKPHADLANVPCADSAHRIAGSAASLLAGTTFVVASCVYWRQ
jgi:hypothetical protein